MGVSTGTVPRQAAPDVVERLLVGVSGSVGVINIASYLVVLRSLPAREIRVVTTEAAERIVPASTIALYCDEVVSGGPDGPRSAAHVELAQWASLFVVLPASANTIGMAANGLAPNLLTATIMAAPPGVVFFPNMNQSMWSNPALKRNLAALQKDGHVVVRPPIRKALEVGTGEMVDAPVLPTPEEICVALRSLVAARTAEADGERAGGAAAR